MIQEPFIFNPLPSGLEEDLQELEINWKRRTRGIIALLIAVTGKERWEEEEKYDWNLRERPQDWSTTNTHPAFPEDPEEEVGKE